MWNFGKIWRWRSLRRWILWLLWILWSRIVAINFGQSRYSVGRHSACVRVRLFTKSSYSLYQMFTKLSRDNVWVLGMFIIIRTFPTSICLVNWTALQCSTLSVTSGETYRYNYIFNVTITTRIFRLMDYFVLSVVVSTVLLLTHGDLLVSETCCRQL